MIGYVSDEDIQARDDFINTNPVLVTPEEDFNNVLIKVLEARHNTTFTKYEGNDVLKPNFLRTDIDADAYTEYYMNEDMLLDKFHNLFLDDNDMMMRLEKYFALKHLQTLYPDEFADPNADFDAIYAAHTTEVDAFHNTFAGPEVVSKITNILTDAEYNSNAIAQHVFPNVLPLPPGALRQYHTYVSVEVYEMCINNLVILILMSFDEFYLTRSLLAKKIYEIVKLMDTFETKVIRKYLDTTDRDYIISVSNAIEEKIILQLSEDIDFEDVENINDRFTYYTLKPAAYDLNVPFYTNMLGHLYYLYMQDNMNHLNFLKRYYLSQFSYLYIDVLYKYVFDINTNAESVDLYINTVHKNFVEPTEYPLFTNESLNVAQGKNMYDFNFNVYNLDDGDAVSATNFVQYYELLGRKYPFSMFILTSDMHGGAANYDFDEAIRLNILLLALNHICSERYYPEHLNKFIMQILIETNVNFTNHGFRIMHRAVKDRHNNFKPEIAAFTLGGDETSTTVADLFLSFLSFLMTIITIITLVIYFAKLYRMATTFAKEHNKTHHTPPEKVKTYDLSFIPKTLNEMQNTEVVEEKLKSIYAYASASKPFSKAQKQFVNDRMESMHSTMKNKGS